MGGLGTTTFGMLKLKEYLADELLPDSAKYVKVWLVKEMAKGLLTLLMERLAGMPALEVVPVRFDAYEVEEFEIIQLKVARLDTLLEEKVVYG